MGRLQRILNNPTKYLSLDYVINNVICKRLFVLWMRLSCLIRSDEIYLKVYYRLGMGRKLNLDNPRTFSEKLQWLKLHNTNPLYSSMVDKLEAREIVKVKIGEKYLVPLLGSWEKFEEIDFAKLPDEFVLKTTHDSGTVSICRNKSTFNIEQAKRTFTRSLQRNYFYKSREYPYLKAKPKIIAESLLKPDPEEGLSDYKFFCFDGIVKLILVVTNQNNSRFNTWFDTEFTQLPLSTGFPKPPAIPRKPDNFEEMLKIAEELSKDIPHVRIDLYNINGNIYFGECTFHHSGGIISFNPDQWDTIIGAYLDLG